MPRRIGRRPTRQIIFVGPDPRPSPPIPSHPNPIQSTGRPPGSTCVERKSVKPIIITLPSSDQDLPISASAHRPIRNPTSSPRKASFPRKPLTHACFRAPPPRRCSPTHTFCDRPATLLTDLAVYPAIAEPTDMRGPCAVSKKKSEGKETFGGVKTPTRAFF